MNRVTRISSAAFGMLLLAGLALYQGNSDYMPGEEGALTGTAVTETSEKPEINCDNTAGLSEKDLEYCARKDHSNKVNPH